MMGPRLQCLNLLLHIFSPFDAFSDFHFISKTGLTRKCFMQSRLEVLVAKRVILAQI